MKETVHENQTSRKPSFQGVDTLPYCYRWKKDGQGSLKGIHRTRLVQVITKDVEKVKYDFPQGICEGCERKITISFVVRNDFVN